MQVPRSPLFRLAIVLLAVVVIFSMPAREFLKITFIMGIPFIFLLSFMIKQRRYSLPWIVSVLVLLAIIGGYGHLLTGLPDRIEVRRIISEGAALVAEGQYDAAIAEYEKLEALGQEAKMHEVVEQAANEKKAAELLNQAKKLIEKGKPDEASDVLGQISADTRAAREAQRILKTNGD